MKEGGVTVKMHAPVGWKLITSKEEPLDWNAVATAPGGKVEFGVDLRAGFAGLNPRQQYEKYLAEVHKTYDPKVRIAEEPPIKLPDGRTLTPYRFFSDYWKERLTVIVPEGKMVTLFELDTPSKSALAASRAAVKAIFASYSATR